MKTPKQTDVLSSLKWQTLAKVIGQTINWAVTIIVIRILDPNDYGLMALSMVIVGLVTLLSELGIGSSIIQSNEINEQQQRYLYGAALILNSTFYVFIIIIAPIIATFFNEPRLENIIPILAIQLPLAAIATLPGAIAARNMRFKEISLIEISLLITTALTTLIAALNEFGVWALVAGHLASSILRPVLLIKFFGTKSPRLGITGLKKYLSFGGAISKWCCILSIFKDTKRFEKSGRSHPSFD